MEVDFQQLLKQMPPEQRAQFLQMLQQRMGQPQGKPNMPLQASGQPTAPGMLPMQPNNLMMKQAPGQVPGQPQPPPGAATPEEAAKAKAETMRRGGVGLQGGGMLGPQQDSGNMFADNQDWFAGLFDTSNRTGPFDSFYTDRQRSNSWL
jgi:hypothetical protein